MSEMRRNEVVIGQEDSPEHEEVIVEFVEDDIVWEEIPDEGELPPGWEDLLYEAWRERQFAKEPEEHSEVTG